MMYSDNIAEANSIFQQPWWLEVVAPGRWDEIIVRNGDHIEARMPYVIKKKYGLTVLDMPPLTQTLGPWLRKSNAKYSNQLTEQKRLMQEVIDNLPTFDYFIQNFSPAISNWLPFYWNGFIQMTKYTYRIEDLNDLDKVWHDFSKNLRTEIRKAEKRLVIRTDLDIETFYQNNQLTFRRQGLKTPYSLEFVKNLDKACLAHNARNILSAEDPEGRIHSTIYLVGDSDIRYCLMAGSDPELRTSGANALLIWEALKFTAKISKIFDFEGSMIESVERFFRSFGAIQRPYFKISKMSKRVTIAQNLRNIAKIMTR